MVRITKKEHQMKTDITLKLKKIINDSINENIRQNNFQIKSIPEIILSVPKINLMEIYQLILHSNYQKY